MKKCVACAEEIQNAAKLCRHCNTLQNDQRFSVPQKPDLLNPHSEATSHEPQSAEKGFMASFLDPQSWNIADAASEPSSIESIFCTSCGVRNSELDSKCGSCGAELTKPHRVNSSDGSKLLGSQIIDSQGAGLDNALDRFVQRLGSDVYFAAAFVYGFLTLFDSLYWISWRDPFGTNSTLLFSQFLEWALPSAALVVLFINAKKPTKNLLITALVVGGAVPLFFDIVLNQTFASNPFSALGIWTFGDFVDFAASVGLIIFASLRLKRI